MQILYLNPDQISSRQLHAEFLSYRGFQWDLLHCPSVSEALRQMDCRRFDVVLYESVAESPRVRDELENLVVHCAPTPVVAVVRDCSPADQLQLIELGVHDTIAERCIDGPWIMRRLRMAQARAARLSAGIRVPAHAVVGPESDQDTGHPLRLLVVETANPFHDVCSQLARLGHSIEIQATDHLEEAAEMLERHEGCFDGVVLDQGAVENQQLEQLKPIRRSIRELPFVMLVLDRSDFAAVSCIEQGFADCLVATATSTREVLFSVRASQARMSRQRQQSATSEAPVSDRRAALRPGSNRRRDARYMMERPVCVYAILPDGSPDQENIYQAQTSDISIGGIGFQIPLLDHLPGRNWLLGFPSRDSDADSMAFINVMLRHIKYETDGIRIGARFRDGDDLFAESQLTPAIDSRTHRVQYGLARQVLDEWLELGVLSRRIVQRAMACPDCHAVVAVGDGCRQCGSADLDFRTLIHHFACAWVDDASHFQSEAGISCPKCLSSGLVVGADFELIKARYECVDCGYEGNESELVCSCFNCLLRFPLRLAREVEIYRYDVRRVDALDILDSAK